MLRALNTELCKAVIVTVILIMMMLSFVNYQLIVDGHMNIEPSTYRDNVTNSVYFTTTTMSSVGYGDILPKTITAKGIVALEQIMVLLLATGIFSISCTNVR
jgi:hypothetical protein